MRYTVLHLIPGLIACLLFSGTARAQDRVVIADFASSAWSGGLPAGWEIKEKSGKADFAVVRDGHVAAARFRSANTSFSLQREIDVDLKAYPLLSWKWKVTKLPAGGDFRKRDTDDQAAQLFVAFSTTKAIVYIWDTTAPQGIAEDTSPVPFMKVVVVVVRSGPQETGKWISEVRNVFEDYRTYFGSDPPPVKGVRLQINSQHTGTSAEGYFSDIAFEKAHEQQQHKN
jgi:hypothetical protein